MKKKIDLNQFIASILSALLTTSGAIMFVAGLLFGYLVAKSPFLVFALLVILAIVLFMFRKKIDFSQIRANMRKTTVSQTAPSPLPPPPPEDAKKEEDKNKEKEKEKKKRIIIELE